MFPAGFRLQGLGFVGSLLASGIGAAVATTALHPVDTIKTRVQCGLPAIDPQNGLPGLYSGVRVLQGCQGPVELGEGAQADEVTVKVRGDTEAQALADKWGRCQKSRGEAAQA